ncbi:hypothetical protein [Streptosporangium sp. NPDC000396]|uniref:hypothetical protein n=1 Tax=Streptosporangium sp. NPDC000396 TaxID=3366185 RepID=UPI0036AEED45
MSHPAKRLTAAALAAALGGTLLFQSPATSAATVAASSTTASASGAAASSFRYEVYFQKYVRRGGYLTYTVKVHNKNVRGQHYVALVGDFSRHFRKIKVIDKPRSVTCSIHRPALACWISSLDKGDATTVKIRAWVGSRRGTATAKFGAVVTDNPDADLDELADEIDGHITAKSKVL